MSVKKLLVILALFSCVGCKPRRDKTKLKVVNGTRTGIEAFRSVVRVSSHFRDRNNKLLLATCSAVIVGPETVFSAAHCFDHPFSGRTHNAFVTLDDGRRIPNCRVYFQPGWHLNSHSKDFAILSCAKESFSAFDFVPLAQKAPEVGDRIVIVGFGNFDHMKKTGAGVKRWGWNKLTEVNRRLTFVGFVNKRSGVAAGTRVLNSQGDSGGPMLNEGGEVIGISSSVDARPRSPSTKDVRHGHYTYLLGPESSRFIMDSIDSGMIGSVAGRNGFSGVPIPIPDGVLEEDDGASPVIPGVEGSDSRSNSRNNEEPDGKVEPIQRDGEPPVHYLSGLKGPCTCKVAPNVFGSGCTVFNADKYPVLQADVDWLCETQRKCFDVFKDDLRIWCTNLP